jgi:MSHA pilin protein MshC
MPGIRAGNGWTLTELVMVIVLAGIIAAVAAPRFFRKSEYDARGYHELSIQATRYAQKLALASGCPVRVVFAPGGFSLQYGGGPCSGAVQRPGGGVFADAAPPGVSVASGSICFDSVGRPRDADCNNLLATAFAIGIGGRTLSVEPATGFIH